MQKIQQILMASTITVLALAACSNQKPPTVENSATPEAASPISSAAEPATADTLTQMKGYLTTADTAINANDFTKAKAEFEEFHENWEKVEDGVKDSSKDAYKQIENGIDEVENNLVRPETPKKEQAIAALQSLSKTLDTHASSLK